MREVSAVLVTKNRPEALEKVIAHLRTIPIIDDIVIWDNSIEKDVKVYGRFLAVERAKHDVIYTQDDDCIVNNIEELWKTWDGEHISAAMLPQSIESYDKQRYGNGQCILIGHGSFFKKEWVKEIQKYLDVFPEDDLFYRTVDRIFTLILNRPHNIITVDLQQLPESATGMSILPDHWETSLTAIQRTASLL